MTQEINNVAEVANAVESAGGIGSLGINLKIFIAQLVNFIVVLFVMWKWAYKPIVNLLDARAKKVEKSIAQADEIEKRMSEMDKESEQLITRTKTEANAILQQARLEAENQKEKIIAKAKNEVQKIVEKGKVQMKSEKVQMLKDVREEIAEIAVTAAEKILKKTVDEKTSQELAQDIIENSL